MEKQKGRNFLKFIGVYFAIAVVAIIGTCCAVSCDDYQSIFQNKQKSVVLFEEELDSISKENIREIINPVFHSVNEALIYRELSRDGVIIDSIFNNLPQKTLMDVASVCIKRMNVTTKGDIVHEYLEHLDVYSNLPNTVITTNTAVEEYTVTTEDKNMISTSYSYRTDTIDGKPRKVQIKKEEKYVVE